ncbi:MAG: hypothetical protein RSC76_01280 [Oscillospiraceae bacterium]
MFYRLFRLDLKCGLLSQWKKYILAILFFFTCSVIFILQWKNQQRAMGYALGVTPSLGDFLLFFFGGCDKYVFTPGRPFLFPAQWILLILFSAYLNLQYASDNLYGVGVHALIHSKSRGLWWLSKSVCVAVGMIIYFLFGILTTVVACFVLGGTPSLEIHPSVMQTLLEIFSMQMRNPLGDMLITYLLVCTVVLALCQLQIFLSILVNPMVSFMIIAAILLLSAYFVTPFLIGNFAMPVRSGQFLMEGLNPAAGFIFAAGIFVVSLLGGWAYCRHMDILGKDE